METPDLSVAADGKGRAIDGHIVLLGEADGDHRYSARSADGLPYRPVVSISTRILTL